jgi:hypothetical protein
MNRLVAWIMRGSDFHWYDILLMLAFLGIIALNRRRKFLLQWLQGMRGRGWATVEASIDVVSVAPQMDTTQYGQEYVVGYVATLTYFYRNPELQTGDYSRRFVHEKDAQAWAERYKGTTTMVHVDPHDPSRSVLRQEELKVA